MSPAMQQRIGLVAWAALAALQVVWHAWLLPPVQVPITVALAIGLLPLALPLFYWREPERAVLVAGMVGLFYFCHGVAEAWASPSERVLAAVEIGLAVVLVVANARKPGRRRPARSNLPS